MMLAYNTTNHKISCHSACQMPCLMFWESTTPVYLVIYVCCNQRMLCHRSYACTCLDHKLELCGRNSVHAHVQLSRVYLASTLDVTHVIMYQALSDLSRPLPSRREWDLGRSLYCWKSGVPLPSREEWDLGRSLYCWKSGVPLPSRREWDLGRDFLWGSSGDALLSV